MYTLLDKRDAGFCSSLKLILNCLKEYPAVDDWYFDIQNTLYGKGNIWDKVVVQKNKSSRSIYWDQGNFKINFLNHGIQQSINWELGYNSNERDKYESKEFIEVFRSSMSQIKFREEILEEVETYKYLINGDTIGVHVRMRDHLNQGHGFKQEENLDLQYVINKIKLSGKNVFLVSDSAKAYSIFSSQLNSLTFIDNKNAYENEEVGLHFLPLSDTSKEKMLKILIVELILLSKCSYLYLMNSNVSHIALFLADHYNFEFYDKNIKYT